VFTECQKFLTSACLYVILMCTELLKILRLYSELSVPEFRWRSQKKKLQINKVPYTYSDNTEISLKFLLPIIAKCCKLLTSESRYCFVVVCCHFIISLSARRIAPPHILRETSPASWSSSNFAGLASRFI